jgi:hypothetical protein
MIADVTINCEDDNSSAAALGSPAFSDNCDATLAESLRPVTQGNDPSDVQLLQLHHHPYLHGNGHLW